MSRIRDALRKAQEERNEAHAEGVVHRGEAGAPGIAEQGECPSGGSPGTGVVDRSQSVTSPLGPLALDAAQLSRWAQSPWKPDPTKTLLINGQKHPMGIEEFRTLRSHLYLLREQRPLQKVLVTSPLPGEGKTFVAANLANAIIRLRDGRTVLVDADLRLSRLHLGLGAAAAPGLTDYLRGEADEGSVLQRGPQGNLFFIPGGRPVPNPSELIGNGRLRILLHRLAAVFDWIILDSPPAIPVSDARLLADICDGVLIVIQAGSTPFDMAQRACRDLRDKRLLGVVLNRADIRSSFSSYYYNRHQSSDGRQKGRAQER